MNSVLLHLSAFFEKLPNVVKKYRLTLWISFILFTLFYGYGAGMFQLDLTDEGFFSKNDPVRIAYNQFKAGFGSDENIYIVYEAKDGNIFSEQSLKAVKDLTTELLNFRLLADNAESSALSRITDIKNIINVSHLQAFDDTLISKQFIGNKLPTDLETIKDIQHQALNHPDYPLLYVSRDARFGGIVIRTDLGGKIKNTEETGPNLSTNEIGEALKDFDISKEIGNISQKKNQTPEFEFVDPVEYAALVNEITGYLDKPVYSEHLLFHPTGNAVVQAYIVDNLLEQINIILLVAILLIAVMLWILFKSMSAVVWPILIIVIASVLTLATLGWLELRMSMMVNVTVFLILVIGVADSVHVLSGYLFYRKNGHNHNNSLSLTYKNTGTAILLTSVTTAIGMLSLLFVPIEELQKFGFSAALGVMLAFVLSTVWLPLMLDIWGPYKTSDKKKQTGKKQFKFDYLQKFLLTTGKFSMKYANVNIIIFSVIFIVFAYGSSKVNVDSNPMNMFDQSTKIVKDFKVVDEKMGGTQTVEVMIDTGVEDGLVDPSLLKTVGKIQEYLLSTFPNEIKKTHSLVNIVKEAGKSLNGGDIEHYTIPSDKQKLKQTLFLFSSANSKERRLVVTDDYRQAHITANFVNVGSKRYVEILNKIQPEMEKYFQEHLSTYPDMKITVTGGMTIYAKLLDLLSWSQIKGFGIAIICISLILFTVFSSAKLGIVSIYVNIFPLVIMFGAMGYLGIPLDVDTLIVAPIMIGIVVDNTIHFVNYFRAEVQRHADVQEGILSAFKEVGQAVLFISFILIAAFSSMAWLDHQGLKNFGILSSITILTALIAELILLPALLSKFRYSASTDNTVVLKPSTA